VTAPFDRAKFIRITGMLGSRHEGERRAAVDRAANMLLQAPPDTRWDEVFGADPEALREALHQVELREQACQQLLVNLEERDARIAELERGAPDWRPIERVESGNHKRTALWVLELHARQQIWLSEKEQNFLGDCAKWIGPQRQKQREWLQKIADRVHQRTGLRPPP
jgi:hypothetical protein